MRITFSWSDAAGEMRISPKAKADILAMAAKGPWGGQGVVALDALKDMMETSIDLYNEAYRLWCAAPRPEGE